jgi:acetate kinase
LTEAVLVVNAGSTSLKLHLVENGESEPVDSFEVPCDAVAHRVVHGGPWFRDPVVIDAAVERRIEELQALAPLHNAPALDGIRRARAAQAAVPHVAVFDTAFHATMPDEAATYALPRRLREELGIRRFGFHGLSVQWAAERVAVPRLVVCHLGGGCSVTAVRDGRSVDTTMGFSPLEGVPMATRSGSVDPGALLHLLREHGFDGQSLDQVLERESGLLGLAGTADARELDAGSLALRVFAHRVAGAVATMAVAAGGLDALVFTAGIGEGSPLVRAEVCARLGFLGVELDGRRNEEAVPDAELAVSGSDVRIVALRAREELVAARAALALLGNEAARQPERGR